MLTFPPNHTPRFTDFSIKAISDETIREGGERALFGASNADKLKLVEKITNSGITDIDVGSGIKEPEFVRQLLRAQDIGDIPKFEDLYNQIIDFYKPIFRLNYVGELGLKILDEESSTKG